VISTANLLAKLNAIDESPWGARRRGEGLDARGLAKLLRPFGIKPRSVRAEGGSKGYHLDQFEDAFVRHLPRAAQAAQAAQSAPHLEPDVPDVPDVPDLETCPREWRGNGQETFGEETAEAAPEWAERLAAKHDEDRLDDLWPNQPYRRFLAEQEGRP
jgi:hypothetical protein